MLYYLLGKLERIFYNHIMSIEELIGLCLRKKLLVFLGSSGLYWH
jgi:hypothetical protein